MARLLALLLILAPLTAWEPTPTLTLLWYPDGLLIRWAGVYGCVRIEREEVTVRTFLCNEAGEVLVPDATPGDVVRYYTGNDVVGAEQVIPQPHYVRLPLVVEAP
jgi:hypothetical protein